nr:MAG TPA: hypothetical protein [Caudoviricetes sp.]
MFMNPNYTSAGDFVLVRAYMAAHGGEGDKPQFKDTVFVVPKSEYKKVVAEYNHIYKKTTACVKFEILEGSLNKLKILSLNGKGEVEQGPFFALYSNLHVNHDKYYLPVDAKPRFEYDKENDVMHIIISGSEPYVYDNYGFGSGGILFAIKLDGAIEKILVFDWSANSEKVLNRFPELRNAARKGDDENVSKW